MQPIGEAVGDGQIPFRSVVSKGPYKIRLLVDDCGRHVRRQDGPGALVANTRAYLVTVTAAPSSHDGTHTVWRASYLTTRCDTFGSPEEFYEMRWPAPRLSTSWLSSVGSDESLTIRREAFSTMFDLVSSGVWGAAATTDMIEVIDSRVVWGSLRSALRALRICCEV